MFVGLLVLRNIFNHDYRKEQMQYLRNSGMSEEQIDRYVPKTAAEREEYSAGIERMRKDIAYLLKEVEELKKEHK